VVTSFVLEAPHGGTLHGRLHLPEAPGPHPAVVLCHGFKGFMTWGFHPYLAELLAARGMAALQLNFSGSGHGPGDDRVTDLEAFRRNTPSRERDDAMRVLSAAGSEVGAGAVDPSRLALFGHSRGGAAALLAAASEAWRDALRALVTWSTIATFERFGPEVVREWRERGFVTVVNARTGQELALGVELLDDLERHRSALDLAAAAGRRTAPWLIVHGSEDETVPVDEGRRLFAAAAQPAELLVVEGGSHTFGALHPFAGPTPQLITAMNATVAWLRRHLVDR